MLNSQHEEEMQALKEQLKSAQDSISRIPVEISLDTNEKKSSAQPSQNSKEDFNFSKMHQQFCEKPITSNKAKKLEHKKTLRGKLSSTEKRSSSNVKRSHSNHTNCTPLKSQKYQMRNLLNVINLSNMSAGKGSRNK